MDFDNLSANMAWQSNLAQKNVVLSSVHSHAARSSKISGTRGPLGSPHENELISFTAHMSQPLCGGLMLLYVPRLMQLSPATNDDCLLIPLRANCVALDNFDIFEEEELTCLLAALHMSAAGMIIGLMP